MEQKSSLNVEVPLSLKRTVVQLAKNEHLKASDIVRRALYAYLEQIKKEAAA